jgi:hypothetical protein
MIGLAPHFDRIFSATSSPEPSGNLKSITGIKSFLFDSQESIANGLLRLDLALLVGKHPLYDLTNRRVVVYH